MAGEHSSKQYDLELLTIRSKVLAMGELVERQFHDAMEVFKSGDFDAAKIVIQDDDLVNQLEIELDNACSHLIVRRQPAANDLRTVMATVKTITDLERIGDEAVKIARTAVNLYQREQRHGTSTTMGLIDHAETVRGIWQCAATMLHQALDTVARLDAAQAATLIAQDEALDHDFRTVTRSLASFMMEDPRTISTAIDTMWVAKAIERIGDHTTNIAEYVIYVVEGRDVRHATSHPSKRG